MLDRSDPLDEVVNVAATCVGTGALGPGRRSVVWVQGCPLHCRGCLAPGWIPDRPANHVPAADLAVWLLVDPDVTGLTFSGGEPMAQAQALAAVARHARRIRDVSVVCFTGYRLRHLRRHPPFPGVAALLAEVDVLIDGPYIAARDDGRGLRGSANQYVHHLTDRHRDDDYRFGDRERTVEIRVRGDEDTAEVLLVGVPTQRMRARLTTAARRVQHEYGQLDQALPVRPGSDR